MQIEDLINQLKERDFPQGEYAVFGSAVMAVRGIREAPNVDVVVSNKLWQDLLSRGHQPDEEGFVRIGALKISNWWFVPTRKDIPTMIKEAEMINGVPFVRIEDVLDYKKRLNGEKDIMDVRLIEQFLDSAVSTNEPVSLGIDDYRGILDIFVKQVRGQLEKSILSLILFGSAARGEAKGGSDLDVFVFFDDKRIKRDDLNYELVSIIHDLRNHSVYKDFVTRGIYPEIYPFLISKSQAQNTLWVFLDATEEGVILYDENNFGTNLIKEIKGKIENLGGRRVKLPNGKSCWILYKDFPQIYDKINI